jgi:hypothetical protein
MSCIFCARCCAVWIGFAVVALSSSLANATVIDTQTFNGHTYKLLDASSWQAAQTEAQTLGGNLVTVNNSAENSFIYTTFGPKALAAAGSLSTKVNLWLGATDMTTEGTWQWISGLSSSFTDWFTAQPQDTYGDEDYAGIRLRGSSSKVPIGHWIDIVADSRLGDRSYGVVEIVSGSAENPPPAPEPASIVLAVMAGAALLMHRRARTRKVSC